MLKCIRDYIVVLQSFMCYGEFSVVGFFKKLNLVFIFCLVVFSSLVPHSADAKNSKLIKDLSVFRNNLKVTTKIGTGNVDDKVNLASIPTIEELKKYPGLIEVNSINEAVDKKGPEGSAITVVGEKDIENNLEADKSLNDAVDELAELNRDMIDVEKFLNCINLDNYKECIKSLEKNKEVWEKLLRFGGRLEYFLKEGKFGKENEKKFEQAYSVWSKLKKLVEEYEKISIGWNPVKLITNTWFKFLNRDSSNFFIREIAREEFFKKMATVLRCAHYCFLIGKSSQ